MDIFRKYLGGPQGVAQSSGAETVERLCDRVQSSTLLDDRRDAVRALKALSKKYRVEVGTRGMDIIIKVLETDRSDAEITGYALDALCNIMSNEPLDSEDEVPNHQLPDDLGAQFTEIFIKQSENVALLLSLLDEYDFHVRWPTVRLLTILLTNKIKELQESILVNPLGISKLMDLMTDSREIIRNDALLLLIQLTKNNANIQKIVAFENAFERLLIIVREEGNSDGGIVVEDCLLFLLNLLKNNTSNQNFFREGSFINKLTIFFDLESESQNSQAGWSAQKVTNIHLMLQVVRTLVSPSNPQQQTSNCQKACFHCGMLQQLCSILMASGVPADVLTETINTVAEVIRGNSQNQEYFASVMAPSTPPRPAIVVLLMSMVNEKQPFVLRCAVLYCFQSFLYKNEVGQSQIIQTLLPTSADVNTITAGQLLCGGLFSADSLSTWFASVAMLHAIMENPTQKEQLLRVQLATSLGSPPVSLLQQCCNILAQGGKLQTRIGLLMLLCTWLAECPIAVTHFLVNTANVPYLISQVSSSEGDEQEMVIQGMCAFLLGNSILFNDNQSETFNKASLRQIIEKRIGVETFTDKLTQIPKNESYTKAAKKPNLNYKQPTEVIFDYGFTKLFKSLESEVLRTVSASGDDKEDVKKKMASIKDHESIVDQYKELIKEQDHELNERRRGMEELKSQNEFSQREIGQLREQVQQLKDQNALFKAQKGSQNTQSTGNMKEEVTSLQQEIERLKLSSTEKDSHIDRLRSDLTLAEAQVLAQTSGEDKENNPNELAVMQATLNRLQSENQQIQATLTERDKELSQLKIEHKEQQDTIEQLKVNSQNSMDTTGSPDSETHVNELKERVSRLSEEKSSLQDRVKRSNEENLNHLDKIHKLEAEISRLGDDKIAVNEELETLKKEQEDLLVLLADQDNKIEKYKSKLKELGHEVEEDEDDDDLLDDDDDDDEDEDDIEN
ncbi:hypothetical protein ScPMuIL_004323 [Solemya velum]